MKLLLKRALIYGFLLLASTHVLALEQAIDDEHPYGLIIDEAQPVEVDDGSTQVQFLFSIPENAYIYKDSLVVTTDAGWPVKLSLPKAEDHFDEFEEKNLPIFRHELSLIANITVPADADLSKSLSGKITYQGCGEKICYRPMSAPFSVSLTGVKQRAPLPWSVRWNRLLHARDFHEVMAAGTFTAFAIAFAAGAITSLTPCVLPVIPLTLAFLLSTASQHKRKRQLAAFVGGIVVMYASLGVLAAILGKSLGFWYQSAGFTVAVALLFAVMGLWALGVFQFQMPPRLQTKLAALQVRGVLGGAYSGATIGLLAAPCVGPIAGPLLVYVATTRDWRVGFALMLSYALGLSLVFLTIGIFAPSFARRFGGKGDVVKKLVGVALLAVSVFYVSGLFQGSAAFAKHKADFFENDFAVAQEKAKSSHQGLMVDFYADWCLPCRELEKTLWSKEDVQKVVKEKFVPVQIDCTRSDEACTKLSSEYGVVGMPTVLFLNANGSEIPTTRKMGDGFSIEEFISDIKQIQLPNTPGTP